MVTSSQNEENQGEKQLETVRVRQAEQTAAKAEQSKTEQQTEAQDSVQLTPPSVAHSAVEAAAHVPSSPQTIAPQENEPETPENFSDLLQEHDALVERKEFHVGQVVEGVIVQIGGEFAYVNIGAKAEATLPVSEILNPEDGKLCQLVGDTIKAKVVAFDQSGIRLSRSMRGGNLALEEAYRAGLAVKASVKAVNKGGYELEVMGQRAFCPLSQIAKGFTQDPNEHIGKSYDFKIIKYAKKGKDLVLSRTALLEEESKLKRDEVLATLKAGLVLEGKVASIQDYGVFVDLGGIDGLVHVSELSYQHVANPKEILSVGQDVKVYVLSIEEGPKGPKLSLSMKKLLEDPFVEAQSWLLPGAQVQGTVKRNTKFGSFIEIAPGIEGLAHISEISWDRNLKRIDDVIKAGQSVQVTILSVEPENRRIALSLKDAQPDPWAQLEERYELGATVSGLVESVADFGIFIRLEPGVVALLPLSEIGAQTQDLKKAQPGDAVQARVVFIDLDRKRITLSTKTDAEAAASPSEKRAHKTFNDDAPRPRRDNRDRDRRGASEEYSEAKGSFATFGDVFAGLKKKK